MDATRAIRYEKIFKKILSLKFCSRNLSKSSQFSQPSMLIAIKKQPEYLEKLNENWWQIVVGNSFDFISIIWLELTFNSIWILSHEKSHLRVILRLMMIWVVWSKLLILVGFTNLTFFLSFAQSFQRPLNVIKYLSVYCSLIKLILCLSLSHFRT